MMLMSVVRAAVLLAIWYVLSGMFDVLHFGTGLVAAIVIAWNYRGMKDATHLSVGRLLLYLPWIIGQIILSNLRVVRIVFLPRMPITPAFIVQPPGVTGPRALTLLGLSTTLTPGTLTVDIDGGEMFVHALDVQSATDVRNGVIAHQVERVFSERAR